MKTISIEAIVDMLLSYCPRRYTDKERLSIITGYEWELEDVPAEKLKIGWKKAISAHDGFMIPPGKFKELCLSEAGCRSLEDDAREAWAILIANLNYHSSPIFKDSAIAEAVRKMGGWKRVCNMLEDEMPFRKQDFVDYYQGARREKREFNPMLKGDDGFMVNGKVQPNYKFIGFDGSEDKQAVLKRIEDREKQNQLALSQIINPMQPLRMA